MRRLKRHFRHDSVVRLGLRSQDLDQLFPWLVLSILCLGCVFFLTQGASLLRLPQVPPISSYVQIDLVSPPSDVAGTPALPRVVRASRQAPQRASPQAASARSSAPEQLATYLRDWERRVARAAGTSLSRQSVPQGRLVVAITIDPSGRLRRVEILRGGTHQDLVRAVQNILRRAAPFPPLPPHWQHPRQDLRIVRTWSFE